MDAVNAFNQELFSLMDSKPPISRAKMISITKSAIKAMKLYKHVVQIVEKFIKKCKPEYKVAGLYVVDSIVRQSRHQFGADKDVFGPRFTKNITGTFENLCLCPVEDRSKIVRVLNLWQKNGVFKIEVIQPLLDMAAGTSSAAAPYTGTDEPGSSPPPAKEPVTAVTANSTMASAAQLQNSDAFAAVAQLFQSSQGQQLQQMLQNFQQHPVKPETNTQPPLHTVQTQAQNITTGLGMVSLQPPLINPPTQSTQQKTAFDKKLLDRFDYDDEPEVGEETKKDEVSSQTSFMQQPPAFPQHLEHFKPPMINMSQDNSHQVSLPPNGQPCGLPPGQSFPVMLPPMGNALPGQPLPGSAGPPGFPVVYPPHNIGQQQQDFSMDVDHSSVRGGRHGRRSHSGSRSPKRRRSRSNSRNRRSRHTRSRSRSRDRRFHSPRSCSQERREREKERERRQKGLPPPKSEMLSICSTTLWVGQLDKRTQQQDVACLLEEFGQIESISMIPPRGCAYIVMIHRQDAFRALQKLSRGTYKVNQKAIKIAWALNKGIKSEFKQFWNVELGVTYIPWSRIREDQLDELKEGGVLDIDTLSPDWSSMRKSLDHQEELTHNGRSEPQQPEETQVLPVAATAAPPAQVPPVQQPMVGVGALQPPVFPGPIGMPPPSFPPGVPPPPFIRPGFNPMQMPPGFPPPGAMPLSHPPSSKGGVEDLPLDPAGLGNRKNDEVPEGPNIFNNQMEHMGNQVGVPPGAPPNAIPGGPPGVLPVVPASGLPGVPASGPPGVLPGVSASGLPGAPPGSLPGVPPGNIQPPSGGLLGARPGIIPLQRPPLALPPHLQRFPPPHGPRPPHPNMPPMPPQMIPRGPHPQIMHHEPPPAKVGFGIPPPHNMRPPFPPHGHGPPPQGPPPPFIRPGGPRGLDGAEEMDSRPFRGERPGLRDREPERDRDWDQDRDRERDRGFGGGRRSFGDGSRGGGADRMDGRERLGDWQEDGGDHRGGGWERDRDRDRDRDKHRDRDRERDRDRDRDRRDWREKRSSLDSDRERGRGDDEKEYGRGESGERGRGEGGGRERGRGTEGKEGERPRRERRERTTRWDRDDRLAELENMDRFRTSNNSGQPRETPVVTVETSKEPSVEVCQKQTESELMAPATEVTTAAGEPMPFEPLPSAQSEPTETKQEAAS
ncbi:SR-related and CTD-associated factor 4 [Anabas testudineus]|uniref:SR-related and CTD-associated factor 4 n=1 Tax=Anabas testudineus TaxID=64144 RepID=UPI000E45EE8C|nr:SR-related and CTD-associated factor 4 [Anabas testudineus]